jgi:hypothetical protein
MAEVYGIFKEGKVEIHVPNSEDFEAILSKGKAENIVIFKEEEVAGLSESEIQSLIAQDNNDDDGIN